MGKQWKESQTLFSRVLKSLQMVTATMKLKDSSPWKKSYDKHSILKSGDIILPTKIHVTSVQFSHSVMSYSLLPHWLQHVRPPCPSSTPGVYPNSCPLCRWCHPTISSSVAHLFSCPQSFPASGSSPVNQLFPSGGQSIIASASASVLPMDI